ncbi:MAG: hypothetical protein JW732_05905 [Dehalococcoidia bacterium]|nr:hypothetical protein [Dehalococcoidia bacterium]
MRSTHLSPDLCYAYAIDITAGVKLPKQGKQFVPQTKAPFLAKRDE